MPSHRLAHSRSSAAPLAWIWVGLIVYASLHPFSGWRWMALGSATQVLQLLWLPTPHSSRFDLWSNFLGYLPLGLLISIAAQRNGRTATSALVRALTAGVILSLLMELLQHLLPMRAPSRIDWALNSAGTAVGALAAAGMSRLGWLVAWQSLRDRWLVPHGAAGLLLLLSWPVGLLFPPPLPFAQGQILLRLAQWLDELLADTAFQGWGLWPDAQGRLAPGLELLTIALGLLAPCLVGYVMTRRLWQRLVLLVGALLIGLSATTLSTALNFGPEHALTWVTPVLQPAIWVALVLGSVLALLPHRLVAALGLVALTSLIALVNQIGTDPYFAQSLQGWEQGRFIRFHGLAQWVGWFWPLGALAFLTARSIAPPTGDGPRGSSSPQWR
ncbi:MAG: VanZ family protein [Burkholderiales bacterium]|jgi:VanZ family protein|nr:VanZ family protein [Burkholderiales bacterium]MBP6250002.1 VanZ family protein [Leptothrix sp. (in: b-proteobacteria)]MBP7519276.1 VanZ family protein [Leptothrix sp. (in: b-proteobacteria)]HQY07196.1 VanZ family protein [Burkholderiaceae bacterium]